MSRRGASPGGWALAAVAAAALAACELDVPLSRVDAQAGDGGAATDAADAALELPRDGGDADADGGAEADGGADAGFARAPAPAGSASAAPAAAAPRSFH